MATTPALFRDTIHLSNTNTYLSKSGNDLVFKDVNNATQLTLTQLNEKSVIVKDEGSTIGVATTLDFVGPGVAASYSSGTATLTITGVQFSGDQVDSTLGYFTNTSASQPIFLRDTQGITIQNDGATQAVNIRPTATNEILIDGDIDLNNHQAKRFRLENLSSTPTAGNVGRVHIRTDTSPLKIQFDDGIVIQSLISKQSGTLTSTRVPFSDSGSSVTDDANFVWNNTTKRFELGGTNPTRLLLTAGTIGTSGQYASELTATLNASAVQETGLTNTITTAGSGTVNKIGSYTRLTGSYTAAGSPIAFWSETDVAGTGNNIQASTSVSPALGNIGLIGFSSATTTGACIGTQTGASNGNLNIAALAKTVTAKNSATNIAVLALSRNTGTSPTEIGGYFGLQTSTPTFTSGALIADNGSSSSPIFIASTNNTAKLTIDSSGILNVDIIQALTTNGDLTIRPNGTGTNVVVTAGKVLKTDTVTANGTTNLTLNAGTTNNSVLINPTGTGKATVLAGKSLQADTVEASTTNSNLTLQPNGTGTRVVVTSGKILGADTVEASATNTDLTIQPNGTATNVVITAGKVLKCDTVTANGTTNLTLNGGTTNNSVLINPTGTGKVTVAAGKTLQADTLEASTTNSNLTLQPNGTGTTVIVTSGKTLSADTLTSTTAATDLTLSATGSNVSVATTKFLKITDATNYAVPYFDTSKRFFTSLTGTSSQVLIGGSPPSFGSVTASMVNNTIIVAAGTNPFTGNISIGGNKITNLGTPTAGTDAANKDYVDNYLDTHGSDYILKYTNIVNGSTVANSSTDTNFDLTYLAAANTLSVGQVIEIKAAGKLSTKTGTGENITFRLKYGTVTIASFALSVPSGMSNIGWWIETHTTIRSIGVSGTGTTHGYAVVRQGTTTTTADIQAFTNNGTSTFDTTTATNYYTSAQWGTADAGNTVTIESLDVAYKIVNNSTVISGLSVRDEGTLLSSSIVDIDFRGEGVVATSSGSQATVTVGSPVIGLKNALLNGALDVWQRGTSFTNMANGYSADRWEYSKNGTVAHNVTRTTDVPTFAQSNQVANYAIRLEVSNPDSSIISTDYALWRQPIEGYFWTGYAQKALVLSFWVKSNITGTYCIAGRNAGLDRSFVKEYTINAANTWEKKEITISASPSAGTWNYTTGRGLDLVFTLSSGSSYNGGTNNTWVTGSYIATTNQVNNSGTIGNYIQFALIQLETGSAATIFERRPFGIEYEMCKRYFTKSFQNDTAPAQNVGTNGSTSDTSSGTGSGALYLTVHLNPRMRVIPTVTTYNPQNTNSDWRRSDNVDIASVIAATTESSFVVYNAVATTDASNHLIHWSANAEI